MEQNSELFENRLRYQIIPTVERMIEKQEAHLKFLHERLNNRSKFSSLPQYVSEVEEMIITGNYYLQHYKYRLEQYEEYLNKHEIYLHLFERS